jgi:hypothetical protein
VLLAELVENVGRVKAGVFAQLPGDGLEGLEKEKGDESAFASTRFISAKRPDSGGKQQTRTLKTITLFEPWRTRR